MNIQTEKIHLLQTILNTTDEGLISDVKAFLSGRKADWSDEMDERALEDVQSGLADADNGHVISHEEAVKLFGKWGLK